MKITTADRKTWYRYETYGEPIKLRQRFFRVTNLIEKLDRKQRRK